MEQAVWLWAVFAFIVAFILFLDLFFLHKDQHEINVRESLLLSGGYIAVSLIFGLFVWNQLGIDHALDYYTGYVIEKSLSIDNLFVMAIIFAAFRIPRIYQHRVLFWGIIGVLILRGLMIGLGATLIHEFEWVLHIFAVFLVFTGIKLLFWKNDNEHEIDVKNNLVVRILKKYFPTAPITGQKFWVKKPSDKNGKILWHITPLFIALVSIEIADVVFAIDSVPAIFAITTEPYIVYTSNIFAILGLRALYFALSATIERFAYLKYAVSLILIFIGVKVFVPLLTSIEKVPPSISLSITLGLIIGGIVFSLYKTRNVK